MRIDEEFRELIPALSEEDYTSLKTSIGHYGCYDPVTVWKEEDILIDGHNRYDICSNLGIEMPEPRLRSFETRDDAKQWMLYHQLGRRNLNGFQRTRLAFKLKPILEAEAKRRMLAGKADPSQDSDQGRVLDAVARKAGVSRDFAHRVEKILAHCPEETIEKLEHGDATVNAAYNEVRRILKKDRPPSPRDTERNDEVSHVRISREQQATWESKAAEQGTTVSDLQRELMDEYCRDTLVFDDVKKRETGAEDYRSDLTERIQQVREDIWEVAKTLHVRFGSEVDDLTESLKLSWAALRGVQDRISR